MFTTRWHLTLSTQRQSSVDLSTQRQLSVHFPTQKQALVHLSAQRWSYVYSLDKVHDILMVGPWAEASCLGPLRVTHPTKVVMVSM